MAPAVERRDHVRRYASDRSNSPTRDRHSPHRKASPRRDRPSAHRRSSPKMRSPARTSSSHKIRSPVKEKLSDRARSPKHERPRSPARTSSSRSPSPRTKRLRQSRAEREVEKVMDKDRGRNASKEGRDKGRHSVHGDKKDVSSDRRLVREKSDVGLMKSSRRDRSISPEERSHRSRQRSRSPPRVPKAGARDEAMNVRAAEQSSDVDHDSVAKMNEAAEALEAKEKQVQQKPSFELSGKLAEETNRFRGVTLLFNEPPDARKPDVRWRLYVFKAGEVLNEPLYIHRQSCYLFGRERRVADIPTDHPSCSKQHAVLQYRLVEKEQPDGLLSKEVSPYLMDLGSTNGTFINDNRIEPQRYYEIFEKDTIKFGNSSREYVLLHENSAG
ncbi:FHA domain-containing protein DDL isoform X2 [Phoenix dactylifera]|uniref:FHA domain-containing protein DDL isoform X2 n=1 Tax=Phoenix dactylifera TaxID=42345 RepID=A0A8B7BSS7_PHODC|nr:FHA domain-containing protein DDL isoform X2 [Phoenix dactylifera]